MFANARISLGVAFLKRPLSATSSAKCIVHAEYVIKTKQYLLTKVTFTHSRSTPLNVKTSEIPCTDICDVLRKLSSRVQHKIDDGYQFDVEGMEIMAEADEDWGDFEMAATMTTSDVEEAHGPFEMATGTGDSSSKRRKLSVLPARGLRARGTSLRPLSQHQKVLQRHH